MSKATKKPAETKKDTTINENVEIEKKDQSLEEIKKEADKSFNKKYTNKKKIAIAALCLLGLGTVGVATPIIVSNANAKVDVTVKSSNTAMEKYKVKVKKGTKISKIKVVELEGYNFVGFFKDEACTKAYKPSDTIKKDSTIYASYKQKQYNINITGDVDNYNLSTNRTVNYGESYTLTITPKAGYFLEGIIVKINGVKVELTNGSYTITNITSDVNVELIESTHTVRVVGDVENYNVSADELIKYNQDYVLTVSPKQGFDLSLLIIKVNNDEISLTNGSYTISNITEDITIELINKKLLTVVIGNVNKQVSFAPNTKIKDVIATIETLEYETSGTVYLDEACTLEADLNEPMTGSTTLHTKTATIDKLSFTWDKTILGWSVSKKDNSISGEIVIPASYTNGEKDGMVKKIGILGDLFDPVNITSIVIPDSIVSLGSEAFCNCENVASLTIGSGITSLSSLSSMRKLESIIVSKENTKYHSNGNCLIETASKTLIKGCITSVIPTDGSVTTIGNGSFRGCSGLTSIEIPSSVTNIGQSAFYGCSGITSINIPNSVTTIGGYAFSSCGNLTSITIPNGVTTIEQGTFSSCIDLAEILLPSGLTMIGSSAFSSCGSLTSITIPNSVTTIENAAFSNCVGLTSIKIPNKVTRLGRNMFENCSGLTTLIVDSNLSLDSQAFVGCDNIVSLTLTKNVTEVDGLNLSNLKTIESITVEDGNTKYHSSGNCLIETATKTLIEGFNTSVIPTNGSVTTVGDSAFWKCRGLTSITIPNTVTTIGSYAFSSCSGLTSITIPNSVTTIGYSAFSGCGSLTSITIPNNVTTIGGSAFSFCGLTSITIPKSVIEIGNALFNGSSDLTTIIVEAGNAKYHSSGNCLIETDSKTLIAGCKTSIIPTDGSVTTIDGSAFRNSRGLTSIIIPYGVTKIEGGAFTDCADLTEITINAEVSINGSAFTGCTGLKTIIIDTVRISNTILTVQSHGNLAQYADTFYIKTGLDVSGSTYLTGNFAKQATSDKDGYDKWVRK